MFLRQIFDPWLAQYAYVVGCQRTGQALVIDPERDVDRYRDLAARNGLEITAVAETHIHADFVSGAQELAADPSIALYLSAEGGEDWQYAWTGSRENVHLLRDADRFHVGKIEIEAIHTPGHTPEHLSFLITDHGAGMETPMALVSGDFLFVGDVGRPDLLERAAGMKGVMEGSAETLQQSLVGRLSQLADYVQVLPAHGAGSACGKSLGAVPVSTIGYERLSNSPWRTAREDGTSFVREILAGQPEPPLYFATMKRVNRDGIEVTGGVPSVPQRDAATFAALAEKNVVVDARDSVADFARGHFPGALHAPLHSAFFSAGCGSFLGEGDGVLLVLERPEDLDLAVRQLYRIGWSRFAGWITQGALEEQDLAGEKLPRVVFEETDLDHLGEGARVLDVRTSAEFERGHLEGAISIPYTRLRERLGEVPKGTRLYVHCGSGKRAGVASSFLAREGYDVVYVDGVCQRCEEIAEREGALH